MNIKVESKKGLPIDKSGTNNYFVSSRCVGTWILINSEYNLHSKYYSQSKHTN
jgi:hypothetical protein